MGGLPVKSSSKSRPSHAGGLLSMFCALLKSFYSATPFHLVQVLLSLYSRVHTYVSGDAYTSALLHSSKQDPDKGKVIYRNASHLAVTCAGGTRSYLLVWLPLSMPLAFCTPFLEPPLFTLFMLLLSPHRLSCTSRLNGARASTMVPGTTSPGKVPIWLEIFW